MNKIYRLVWSHVHNAFIVAPETTKGHKKRSGRTVLRVSLAVAATLSTIPAYADDINWADAYPAYTFPGSTNYDQILSTGYAFTLDGDTVTENHYAAGTTLNILGPIPSITAGSNGSATPLPVRDGLTDSTGTNADPGRITFIQATDSEGVVTDITSENIDQFSYSINPSTPLQDQELNVIVPGLEGGYSVVKVYDSSTFSSPGTSLIGDLSLSLYDPTSFRIYNNFGIVNVTSVGGTANINIGADTNSTTAIAAPENTLELLAKSSTLARAEATGSASSQVNWLSDNYIHFAPATVLPSDEITVSRSSTQYNDSITLPNYIKVGTRILQNPLQPNITFTINSAQDIAKVNDFLLGQGDYSGRTGQVQLWLTGKITLPDYSTTVIDSAAIAQNVYNQIIQGLLATADQNKIELTYHLWDDKLSHTNNATLGTGELNVIYASGSLATGNVTSEGSLAVDGATAVMRGDSNATLTNDGNINIWRSSTSSPVGVGMQVINAVAVNNGTINAGLFLEKDGTNQNPHNHGSEGMQGTGASTLTNNGYINVALTDTNTALTTGMKAQGTTTATNTGTIAVVGDVIHNTQGRATGYGVSLSNDATFINQAGGEIYVGTTPITASAGYSPVVMVGGTKQSAGIITTSSGQATNEGTITLGESTRNAVGMLVDGGTGLVTNNGIINVLGKLTNGAAASNYGLSVNNTTNVINNGQINVEGDNNIAINVLAQTDAATVNSTNTAVITVGAAGDTGGSDNNPYTYRNYAVFAEGLSGNQAIANVDSTINLLAAGSIGVHARGSATIDVNSDASVMFNNSQQIGYYAYGKDSKINLGNAVLNDNAQTGSILFLIDHGARFDGDSGTSAGAYELTVNGTGSTGVFAHGLDKGPDGTQGSSDDILTTLNTGTATITVNGENAVGVKVAGGAQGTINNGGIILSHNNTTAVVIDGRTYTLDGIIGPASEALTTKVTSNAETTTTASQSGIKGYDVSYKGEVTLNGNGINLNGSDNIGLYLHQDGIGINNAPVSVSGTNNIGVYIQDKGTLTNNNDITVSGAAGSGNVGVKVQGSGAKVTQLGNVTANGGLAAVQLINDGATLAIEGTGNHITASGGADGIRMDAGSSSLTASNTVIDILGSGAGINNNADTANINLNNVTINAADGPAIRTAVTFAAEGSGNILNVSGSGSGFAFEQADGSNTTGNLTIGTGYTINVTGADGVGILAKTDGNVTSGANITMGATSGAAIEATDAASVTNSGNIQTSSDVNSSILADNASRFTNSGTINSSSTLNPQALIQINGSAASRTIQNTGKITSSSTSATSTLIDASGSANNTITNRSTLQAANAGISAILSGSGNDSITLQGGTTRGLINAGSGQDTFTWNSGTFSGAVDFTGADGNDTVSLGNVDLGQVSHILSEGGTNNRLTLTNTNLWNGTAASARIGSLAADNLSSATNIGTGWSNLTITGSQADVRVVDNLQLTGSQTINLSDGATLRSGNNATSASLASISNYNVVTSGTASKVIFDGTSATQTYSGIISGDGQVQRATGGTTTLLGNNTWTGNTTIDAGGVLQLGNGGTTGGISVLSAITDNGILAVNRQDDVQFDLVISGSGAFHQIGAGTTRLNAANSYKDETRVTGGTLLVNGNQSAATGVTNVYDGATLGGNGTIGGNVIFAESNAPLAGNLSAFAVTTNTLSPGNNGTGTLTINGDLSLASTTNSQFELGQAYTPGGSLNDLVNVGGNLILDGDLNVTVSSGGVFLPGVYRLFNYDGTLTDNGLEIASLPPNNSDEYDVQTTIPNQVNLVLNFPANSHQLQYWDGPDIDGHHGATGIEGNGVVDGGTDVWEAHDNVSGNDWTTADGLGNAPWSQGDFAIFMGTRGTVTVSDTNGPVITSGMQFTTDGYTLNGESNSAYPDGTVPLTMVKTTDQLPDVNYSSEGETAADGYFAIRVGAGSAGSDITTTINTDLIEYSGSSDILKLIKYDPGRLILRGNNDYRGGTEIYDGTLNIAKDASLGLAGTSVLINNNSTLQIGDDLITDRALFLSENGGGQFDLYGNTFTPAGLIGGEGQLTVLDSSASSDDSLLVLNRANTYQGATTVTGKDGAAQVTVDVNATGALGLESSDVTVNHQATVNFNNDALAQSHTFALDDSYLNFNNTASAASGVVNADNGSVVNLSASATAAQGQFTLDDSTLNFSDTTTAANSTVNASNGSVVNMTDNANGGQAKFTLASGTQMNLNDQVNAGSSQITNSGRVTLSDNAQGERAVIVNNAGGVVNTAGIANTTTIGSLSGAGNVELGTATLNEGSLSRNDTISGVISGAGGSLNKVGSGTLTLTGDNTWTGTTAVQQGILLVNGNQKAATGDISVASGTTLGGAGVMGGTVTVADNGHLAPGADLSRVGVFTLGGLTLNENAQLEFQFGQSNTVGGSLNDLLNVDGDLTLNGKLNIAQTPGGNFDVGVYRVINYTGNFINNILEIGTAPDAADDLYVQTSIANQVNLVNRTGLQLRFWDGFGGTNGVLKNNNIIDGGNGIWQNSNGNDNWTTDTTDPEGAINAPFSDGSFAVFGGEKGNVAVDNSLGKILISGMQFSTDGYVINDGVITANAADTIIRVGDGTADGAKYTATVNSVIDGIGMIDKTDAGTLVLNATNLYTGGTAVRGGTLQVSGDNNLGLIDTGVTLNGGTFRYGAAFNTARTMTMGENGGTVDTNGNSVELLSAVIGQGALTKTGEGSLILTQNSQYRGGTTIDEGHLQLGTGGTTGSIMGNVVDNGVLQINRSNTLQLSGNISGTGQLWQQGSGTTVLSGTNSYAGVTLVESGTLLAQGANKLSAASGHVVSRSALLDTGGDNQTVAGLVNQGTVNLRGGDIGSSLTVKGNYVGLDGVLQIAAQQHSPGIADKLVIDGGKATGLTLLDIDASQLGEQTEGDGILVVEALNGATTTAQSTKDAFTLGTDHIEAGAFEYRLFAGNAQGSGEDWFLRTAYRPEVPVFDSVASTVRQADLAVLGTLHLRVGDEQPYRADVAADQDARVWMRYIAQTNKQSFSDATRTKADSHMNGMQVGFDIYNDESWRAGFYTTALDTDTSIRGANSGGYGAAGYNSTFSFYFGGYATWTAENGFYVDNVLQYGHHSIDLKNSNNGTTYSPDGNSFIASVEAGKPFFFGNSTWALEPQAQIIYQHSNFDDVVLEGDAKTRASIDADDAVIGRLGLRLTTEFDTNKGKVKPYVRVNYWQPLTNGSDSATYQNTVNNAGVTELTANQRYSSTEVAVGTTWTITPDVQAYTEVGRSYQNGNKDTKIENDFNGSVGVKIRF